MTDTAIVSCAGCSTQLRVPVNTSGRAIKCPRCGEQQVVPDCTPDPEVQISVVQPHTPPPAPAPGKFCHHCGGAIAAAAAVCPRCGVWQATAPSLTGNSGPSRNSVKIPLLISAIANIVLALFWLATLIGIPIAIGLAVLSVFEWKAYADADQLSLPALANRAQLLGICEIVGGLFNTVTLVCGILNLIQSSKLRKLPRSA